MTADRPPGGSRTASNLGGAAVVAITAALAALIRFAGPAIYDGDGWFHVRYATILRDHGISRSFPWWQESFLATRFTDFNLLYHLLLIPFTLGNELLGAQIAAVVLAAAAMGAFWWAIRSLDVPHAWLWPFALLAAAPDFTYRLTYTRPLVLAFALTFLGTSAILRGRGKAAFVLTLLYAHTHCSFHVLPCLAILHDTQRKLPPGSGVRARYRTTGWTLAGAVAGSVLTPYFPNNLAFWWTANVGVLRASWGMGKLLRVGTEMLPVPSNELLSANLGVFILFGLALYGLTLGNRSSAEARTLLVTAFGFFGLSFLSQRFAELWAPFTVLLAGVVLRDRLADFEDPWARLRRPAWRYGVVACATLVVALALWRGTAADVDAARAEDPPRWREAGRWMKANIPEGETIFHLGWDEFPELFYEDTIHRFLIGQDATFFYATDPGRCRRWADLALGRSDDVWRDLRETFRCRWAFIPRRYVSFLKLAALDPRFEVAWEDANALVIRAGDPGDGRPVVEWDVADFVPDPLWRGFDGPLGAGPGNAGAPGRLSGRPFVDLARGANVPPEMRDVCAVASSTIDAASARDGVLGITTDDEVKLYVNGGLGYAHSPYRTPPPPFDLADLGKPHPLGPKEARVPVRLVAGRNALLVEDCRVGDDFGFVLRELR